MASLEGKLSQIGDAIIFTEANTYFAAMASQMQTDAGVDVKVEYSYLSEAEWIDDLRQSLSDSITGGDGTDPQAVADSLNQEGGEFTPEQITEVQPALDKTKSILEIAKQTELYDKLKAFINQLCDNPSLHGAFDPPLPQPSTSKVHSSIFEIPSQQANDVRRYGRYIHLGDQAQRNTPAYKWLVNNAPLYGFVLYFDTGVYYIGLENIKGLVKTTPLVDFINQYQREAIPAGEIQVTSETIQAAEDPIQPVTEKTPSGTMYFSGPGNPLLVVFGGIDVNGEASGIYMPQYFDTVYTKYNVWIADSSRVNGAKSYQEINDYLTTKGANPPYRYLYAFSGGYSPSKAIATANNAEFQKVFLVDIWMNKDSYWPNYVKSNAAKTSYFYTNYGPGVGEGKDGDQRQAEILASLGYPPKEQDSAHFGKDHMATNNLAVAFL